VSFREIAALLLGGSRKGLILVLQAYFDDAGTHKDARVVAWGGFIGLGSQWADLDDAWRAKLARPFDRPEHAKPPLKRFHLAECQALDGEFRGYTRTEADALQHDFREIISRCALVGVTFCVDRIAYDRLVMGEAREFLGDPEQACFGSCFGGALKQAKKYYPNEDRIALVFDYVTNMERQEKLRSVADRVEQESGSKPHIVGAWFGKVIENTPLQAADILATENYWDALAFLKNHNRVPRPHFKHLLSSIECIGNIMREQEIRNYLTKYGFDPPA
jgi:hypothetical protein